MTDANDAAGLLKLTSLRAWSRSADMRGSNKGPRHG